MSQTHDSRIRDGLFSLSDADRAKLWIEAAYGVSPLNAECGVRHGHARSWAIALRQLTVPMAQPRENAVPARSSFGLPATSVR
jgi:hypothetical protein